MEGSRRGARMYTVEYYATLKGREILSSAGKWMNLEIITLNNLNQTQKDEYRIFCLMSAP